MSNKKAQVHIAILIMIAIAAAGMVLYAVISSNNNLQTQSESLASLTNSLNFNEKYLRAETELITQEAVNNCLGCSTEALKEQIKVQAENKNLKLVGTANFFGKTRTKDFAVEENSQNFTVNYKEILVTSENDAGKLQRTFSICLTLSKDGKQETLC